MQRRGLLIGGGLALGAAGVAWWQRNTLTRQFLTRKHHTRMLTDAPMGNEVCVLTSRQIEGPYFVSAPERSNIVEDRVGEPLSLELALVRAQDCAPLADHLVEVWHCDAAGHYSGQPPALSRRPFDLMLQDTDERGRIAPINDAMFLRGAQRSDAAGRVRFQTIIPGWYEPRAPHIHVQVFDGQHSVMTTQLYFPEAFTEQLFASHPSYQPFGASPYHLRNDIVIGQASAGAGLLLRPQANASGQRAVATLGLT